ncbi:MAG: hypothetical protein OEY85_01625 [Rhodospirillales bacterium]|nr:hypothetical protein [Rhodospirillales bacterium]
MAEVTEIYICREGQSLKQGKVEYSHSIEVREDAEDDAKRRCRGVSAIQKVAYYRVNDQGDFRIFYSFTNPDFIAKADREEEAKKKPKRRKRKKPKTLWQKIMGVLQ